MLLKKAWKRAMSSFDSITLCLSIVNEVSNLSRLFNLQEIDTQSSFSYYKCKQNCRCEMKYEPMWSTHVVLCPSVRPPSVPPPRPRSCIFFQSDISGIACLPLPP